MLNDFLTLLKEAKGQYEKIFRELEGYVYKTAKKGSGKKKEVIEIETAPLRQPKYRISPTLQHIILTFYPDVTLKRTSAATMLCLWEDEITLSSNDKLQTYVKIFELLQPFLQKFYLTEGGLAVGATTWRKPLKAKFGEKNDIYIQSVHMLGLSQDRAAARRDEYTSKVLSKVSNREATKYTKDFILSVIEDAASSANPIKNLVAVMLATGSRVVEVLKVSTYEKSPDTNDCIKVIGVAKDQEEKRTGKPKEIIRPLIGLNVDKTLELISAIRKMRDFESLDNHEVSQSITSSLNKTVSDYFDILDILTVDASTVGNKTTPHKLRYIWVSLAYQLHGGVTPEQEWIRSMLGHTSGDTSLIYTQIIVSLDPIEGVPVATFSDCQDLASKVPNSMEREVKIEAQVRYPQFMNPVRIRLGYDKQLEMIQELDRAYDGDGIVMKQLDAKKHRFGSKVVTSYWKVRPEKF
jgi:hypothetical protein